MSLRASPLARYNYRLRSHANSMISLEKIGRVRAPIDRHPGFLAGEASSRAAGRSDMLLGTRSAKTGNATRITRQAPMAIQKSMVPVKMRPMRRLWSRRLTRRPVGFWTRSGLLRTVSRRCEVSNTTVPGTIGRVQVLQGHCHFNQGRHLCRVFSLLQLGLPSLASYPWRPPRTIRRRSRSIDKPL